MNQTLQLHNRHTGERLRLTRGVEDGREVLYLEGVLPPHSEGPPMHIHLDQDESGEVVSGRLSAIMDGKTITLGTGERAFFPRGVRHRWWNAGDEPLVFKGKADPAGDLDQFLEGIFAIINASATGRPSLFHIAHLSLRHPSQRLSPAPAWVDRIVFRIIVAIGTLVGAYPASGWPGAPSIGRGGDTPRTTLA
ncbi:MAG TPA: cupin domain-containing protein [Vicinamibacterales bacterium]|nr:cupin domain-containing protein [Vicinamibacterales bacterium]